MGVYNRLLGVEIGTQGEKRREKGETSTDAQVQGADIDAHTSMHTRARAHTHTHAYTHTHMHTHTCTHTHAHTCTHAHMHTCTHAHTHTRINAHTQQASFWAR